MKRFPSPAGRGPAGRRRPMAPMLAVQAVEPYANGRVLAWAALQQSERDEAFLQEIFADFDSRHHLSAAERALAVDIASGVVRRRRTLDRILESRVARPRSQTEPELWQILRMGACQLLFARTPQHAAVAATVELCRLLGRERWTGFVNGILRSICRLTELSPDAPATAGPSRSTLPINGGGWLPLNEDIFPDPITDRVAWFGDVFSLPSVLAARWVARMDDPTLIRTGFYCCEPPTVAIRVNQLASTTESVAEQLTEAGCEVLPGHIPQSLLLPRSQRIDQLPGWSDGCWSVQDESAMHAGLLLAPRPGEQILDLCAAPGGKSAHLAELSGDKALITACDVSDRRLHRVSDNARRLKLQSVHTRLISRDGSDLPAGPFDAVLVDAPCTNTGVLARRPEARWRFSEQSQQELIVLQTRLLFEAIQRLRPGGRVVYSTCSIEPAENIGVVQAVMSALPQLQLVQQCEHLPGQPADGAWQCMLRSPH
ncbi:MAG: RsmB/NOP family class I SAM-dependent RNA methyltransferase [Planctomyces sp.]